MTFQTAKSKRQGTKFAVAIAAVFAAASIAEARVTRIVIETIGTAGTTHQTLAGKAYGELDPADAHNAIITDIELAPRVGGKVQYTATFFLVKPNNMATASGLMWHDVPNRGGRITINATERGFRDVGLSSGWQGDNSGGTAQVAGRDWVNVPVATNGSEPIRGLIMGRIMNAEGSGSKPIIVHSNPLPYVPEDLDTTKATLTTHTHETIDGVVTEGPTVAPEDWAWAQCTTWDDRVPNPRQICLKNGFDPTLLYQVVFTAKDPPVLGIGFAAFRDVGAFFRYETQDDVGTPNPVAGKINWVIARGSSQSGNMLRQFLHLGFSQDEANRKLYDGMWPIIAGRRVALNFRWAQPDGVLKLYEPGSEGPQWWQRHPDQVRGLPPRGILDRCLRTETCPKVIEHFGAAEVWALKLSPEWVGTDGKSDIPLPDNVRRYYIPSTRHGGNNNAPNQGFTTASLPPPECPSEGYGDGTLADNMIPHTHTVNALRVHFRNWVMNGTLPPPSMYPTLNGPKGERNLVDATKEAMGFPTLPGLPPTLPSNFINPVLDYDFGPLFNYSDGSGIPTLAPPLVKQVIRMMVPRVDSDGNELGGVPVVLRDAPLGTYLGWNITIAGFHQGKICNYAGGMIPFARTLDDRMAAGDPRPSLQERYGTHQGYVDAVSAAAANAVAKGFLLQSDANALIAAAQASNVLNP